MTVEFQSQSVTAEEHPCEQEQEQGGDTETIAPLADDDARKDEHCAKEKNVFWCECHVVNVSSFVIVKTCSDSLFIILQKNCPMTFAKLHRFSHSHKRMTFYQLHSVL